MEDKQSTKEIESLKKDLASLRSCLVGFDGKNGLRGQIKALHQELEAMKISHKEIIELLTGIRIQQKSCPYVYSTKAENDILKEEILKKLDKMEQERKREKENFQNEEGKQERYIETIKYTRVSIYLAFAALIASIVFNVISAVYLG